MNVGNKAGVWLNVENQPVGNVGKQRKKTAIEMVSLRLHPREQLTEPYYCTQLCFDCAGSLSVYGDNKRIFYGFHQLPETTTRLSNCNSVS